MRKAEIFINNRGSGTLADGTWVGWENYRCGPPVNTGHIVWSSDLGFRTGRVSRLKGILGFRVRVSNLQIRST